MEIPTLFKPRKEDYTFIKKHFKGIFKESLKTFLEKDYFITRIFDDSNKLIALCCFDPYEESKEWCLCWYCIDKKWNYWLIMICNVANSSQ